MKITELMPRPKRITETGNEVCVPAEVCCSEEMKAATDALKYYAKKERGIDFTDGSSGVRLYTDSSVPAEGYRLICNENGIDAYASSVVGMHHAVSVIVQLISECENGEKVVIMPCVTIEDEPDAPYRGLMIDLARLHHDIEWLYRYADLCYMNRASHLHIHLTDDQSFTVPIKEFPLANTYSEEELTDFAEYANSRGIVIVPEVDVPGHTYPLRQAYPEVFGSSTVMCASDKAFEAVELIYRRVHELFPYSPWIHIGGDEADISGWERCPVTQEYMKEHGIASVGEMYAEYVRIATEMIFKLGCTPVVWEGFAKEYNDCISKDVIVIAWESLYQPAYDLAAAGFRLINCSWEPLYIVTDSKYWNKEDILAWNMWTWKNWWEKSLAYPDGFTIPKDSADLLGGQLCAWGDVISSTPDPNSALEREYALICERLPALCERTWNAY